MSMKGGRYNRQETLKLDRSKSITVIGCGGIGYWVAKILAMSGINKIILFDPDILEEVNLNRMDVPIRYIGMNKADIAKIAIENLRDDIIVYSYPFIYNESADKTDWVIDCTDNVKAQLDNQEIANKMGSRYFKAGYDGENFGIHNEIAEWSTNDDNENDEGGYTIVPSWSVPAMIVAAMSVAKVMKYPELEAISNVKNLFKMTR